MRARDLIKVLAVSINLICFNSFYIGAKLATKGESQSLKFGIISATRDVASQDHVAVADDIYHADTPSITACVRKVGSKCQFYPCMQKNESVIALNATFNNIGYAARFVHRDSNVKREQMATPTGGDWGAGCAVSDKYKFVYVHVLKSGGSTTKEFLRKSICGEEAGVDANKCNAFKSTIRPMGCSMAVRQHPHYFFFSFARNPFTRMFSMYSMIDGFKGSTKSKGISASERPKLLRNHHRRLSTEDFSFADFVLKPGERKKHTFMSSSHYHQQNNFLFSWQMCPTFDFLGRVEHYDEDMKTILRYVGATEMLDYFNGINGTVKVINTWGANKKSSMEGDLRSVYTQDVVDEVVKGYQADFDLLGYDKTVVPQF